MSRRGWRQSDLARASGVSSAAISRILTDTRDRLTKMPDDETVDGLARAFDVERSNVLAVIGEAMGLPTVTHKSALEDATVDELLNELRARTYPPRK